MSTPEEIKAEYTSSLADLTFNSKPLINVLTMLADENSPNAKVIVEAIETHLSKVPIDVKLPILYLIDCIVKNVGGTYTSLFSQNIVSMFCGVFTAVDEKTRAEMFKLRQTWNDVFPQKKLYAIDVQINLLDPAWPVTALPPSNSIYFNPKFLQTNAAPPTKPKAETEPTPRLSSANPANVNKETLLMQEKLIQKQKELLELQQKKLELEVLQTQVKLQEQIKHNVPNVPITGRPQNILLKPEVAKQLVPTLTRKGSGMGVTLPQRLQINPSNGTRINPVNSNLIAAAGNKPTIRDPRLLRQQQKSNITSNEPQKTGTADNNRIASKLTARKPRTDPRLTNKEDQDKDSAKLASPMKVRHAKKSSGSDTSSLKSNSSSSLDSPTKAKNDLSQQSPTKQKKKKKGEEKKASPKGQKPEGDGMFKGLKGSVKNRNYVRRVVGSASPEPRQDEDLRAFGPPEKQPRLQGEAAEEQNTNVGAPAKGMDVDLRQLPALIGKKRTSTESPDHSSAKKSKSEILDKLFGDEDTDLRRLPLDSPRPLPALAAEPSAPLAEPRPPTPPPPIISSSSEKEREREEEESQKSSLDAVRAKLANATNRDKVMAKSFNKKKMKVLEDLDLRFPKPAPSTINSKIIISPEDENNIKRGNLTPEQSNQLLQKIVMQMEKNKLKEAKKKDKEDSFNVSLQPISDEEFVDTDDETEKEKKEEPAPIEEREESLIPFKDKDERLNVAPLVDFVPPAFSGGMRRFPAPWRARRTPWAEVGGPPPPMPRMPPVRPPWGVANVWRGFAPPPGGGFRGEFEGGSRSPVEAVVERPISEAVDDDEIKSIAIDGVQKDIRFYGEMGIVFVNWDDPRELTFQDDGVRRLTFNDDEPIVLGFNRPYEEVLVNGSPHLVRIGAPSREIFIDRAPYECFFGSAGICINLDGARTRVKLEGPPPPVKIGETRRSDVVAGKINLFIDAKIVVPVFLDARVQRFSLDGQTNTLKFVNALESVLINEVLFDVEYGGLPKPIVVHGKKRFIRFSVLPKGVRAGRAKIVDMERLGEEALQEEDSRDSTSEPYDPALPIAERAGDGGESPERSSGSPNSFQNILQQQNLTNLDALSNAMTGPAQPTTGSYQVDNQPGGREARAERPVGLPAAPALNINDLFQKLVASGFVTSSEGERPAGAVEKAAGAVEIAAGAVEIAAGAVEKSAGAVEKPAGAVEKSGAGKDGGRLSPVKVVPPQPDPSIASSQRSRKNLETLRPLTFKKPEQFRIRQNGLYKILYSGMQCSSCGMRFSTDATVQYSQHLDWHFRQNRKGKRNSRVAASRRWYYSLADWKNYEEVEDLEEREKNFFDQQQQAEGAADEDEQDAEVPSVTADPDSTAECCAVCRDKFDQFFHEEREEWHLRNAIRAEEKTYHPVCYEDYQQSLLDNTADESKIEPVEEKSEDRLIPGLEIVIDDDDEDDEGETNDHGDKEPPEVVSLESDESKPVEDGEGGESQQAAPEPEEEDDDDDDVILNEVAPIKIVVDDDDEELLSEGVFSDPDAVKVKRESLDDGFVEVSSLVSLQNGKQIKIKSEPIDPDDVRPITPPPKDPPTPTSDPPTITHTSLPSHVDQVSSMDGNVEMAVSAVATNRIKINISKPIPAVGKEKEGGGIGGEEMPPCLDAPELEPAALKEGLKGVRLTKLPPVSKGKDLTGLCSIM
ncbi:unnamed protein product [Phaedon cochleariae]|uniref:Pre-mRNA cleavage complex 2 protein Pcf11 n=1 Tax=Phaedon cochleariae TaxID=80249 RepID=A0A9N9SER3_PHACE|nr:unnamed protein product [Phaedon cochleariae]